MSGGAVPEHVRTLIEQRIFSVEAIEILLSLRAEPTRSWTCDELSRELRRAPETALLRLRRLALAGLIVADEGERYRYAPETRALAESVDGLADAYRNHKVAIVRLVFEKSEDVTAEFDRRGRA